MSSPESWGDGTRSVRAGDAVPVPGAPLRPSPVFAAPFHLAGSFLRANYLRWTDKLRVAYGLARLRSKRGDRPGESFADWLLRHGQTIRTINLYWATVLVSALNERLDQMDVVLPGDGEELLRDHGDLLAEPVNETLYGVIHERDRVTRS